MESSPAYRRVRSDPETHNNQKDDAQHRKLKWGSSPAFAWFSVSLVFVGLSYSVVVNFLAMFPSTMCLKIAGGSGC